MPAPFDNDLHQTSSGNHQPGKTFTKTSSAGVQIPTRNGKKNGTAKDGGSGGVMAAVTRNNASKSGKNKPVTVTPPSDSPESKPVIPTKHGNPVSSPLLDALSSASSGPSVSQNTNEWAKNLPAYSSSPSNLINLGESPPTMPSSYEDKPTNYSWSTKEQKGTRNGTPSSASPPTTNPSPPTPQSSLPISRRRPLSYQMDGNLPYSPEEHPSHLSSYAAHRNSMYSPQPQSTRYGAYPPLPHQPQAHFYGAPDANLLLSPRAPGLVPGEKGYYCGFDSLPSTLGFSKPAESVMITGYEGGLVIHTVTKRGLNKVYSLDGLRGGVYNAKILPWTTSQGNMSQFPLIAVVVHGPVWTTSDRSSGEYVMPPESTSGNHIESMPGSPGLPPHSVQGDDESVDYYQTSVELYSLGTRKHVTTLLVAPKIQVSFPISSLLFAPPSPVGSFTIRADRGHVVVASGVTGETWIFRQRELVSPNIEFRCLGKVWTTVQHGLSVDTTALSGFAENGQLSDSSPRSPYRASILSLNGRWLAYCPSAASSQISLRATIPEGLSDGRVPGLNTFAPPHLPAVNCLVDSPGGEGVMNKVLQAATQGLVEISGYVGKQGAQYWNNYWNKSSAQQSNGGNMHRPPPNISAQFPPTHGGSSQTNPANKDPGLISILDLGSLAQQSSGTSIHPLATFPVPYGCSFLSLAPSGLALFTASSKGDVQFVWDLMRLHFSRSSLLKGNNQPGTPPGPHVRQIAQFSRMTIARIVDVVWTSPHGERAAMVTEPGTIHVLDLPASAFTWPPPRRKLVSQNFDKGSSNSGNTALSAVGVASSAVNSLWGVARPLVSSRRRRSSVGISGITAASVKTQAGHGTQALAAGISRSVGAATGKMNEMRKGGNAKLQLPKSGIIPSPNCVRLFSGKHGDSILAVGGGVVRIYTVKSRRADRPADKQKASRGAKYVEYRLPSLPDVKIAPEPVHGLAPDDGLELPGRNVDDNRKHRQVSNRVSRAAGAETSIPQAEIESNAPYQPFHTDRRVGLHVYHHEPASLPSPSVSTLFSPTNPPQEPLSASVVKSSPWAFGGPIKTIKLDVGPPQIAEDDFEDPLDHRALPSSAIERVMRFADGEHHDAEQIVVTTRRRKGAAHGSADNSGDADEEGFFEDDCEVLDFASQRV